MKSLYISLNTAHSATSQAPSCHHSYILSKSSCSYPYTSPLPPPNFYMLTPNHPHFYAPDAQTISIYYASLHLPLSVYPKDYKFTLRFLSFNDTPHIHLTIIRPILSRLRRFSSLIAQVSVPYNWTQALYIFPFIWYDAP